MGGHAGDAEDPRLTEARNPRTSDIDRAGTAEIVRWIQAEDRAVGRAVEAEAAAIVELVERVTARLRRGGRLFYVGAGTSGRLGMLDAAELPPTFGTDPARVQGIIAGGPEALVRSREGAEDDVEAGRNAMRAAGVGAGDFVLGIAASGTTPFVTAALEVAAARGAGIGFLSCTEPPPRVRELAEVVVTPLVGPEVIAGSTRMKAGTATKLVLNTLTTAAMIRSGKVYRNLMVDLRAVSVKLVERSLRIVQAAAEVDRERARELLLAAGGSAKTAIAMERLAADRYTAERLLASCDGFLGVALERWGKVHPRPEYACWPEIVAAEEAAALVERLVAFPGRLRDALEEAAGSEAAGSEAAGGAAVRPPGDWTPVDHAAHLLAFEAEAVRPRLEALGARETTDALATFPSWEPGPGAPGVGRDPTEIVRALESERRRSVASLPASGGRGFARRLRIGGEEATLHQFLRGVSFHDEAHLLRVRERIHPALLGEAGGERGAPSRGEG